MRAASLVTMLLAGAAAADPGRLALEPFIQLGWSGEVSNELYVPAVPPIQQVLLERWTTDRQDWTTRGGFRFILPLSDRLSLRGGYSLAKQESEQTDLEGLTTKQARAWRWNHEGQLSLRIWIGTPRGRAEED